LVLVVILYRLDRATTDELDAVAEVDAQVMRLESDPQRGIGSSVAEHPAFASQVPRGVAGAM
jgi:hypothetical protein